MEPSPTRSHSDRRFVFAPLSQVHHLLCGGLQKRLAVRVNLDLHSMDLLSFLSLSFLPFFPSSVSHLSSITQLAECPLDFPHLQLCVLCAVRS